MRALHRGRDVRRSLDAAAVGLLCITSSSYGRRAPAGGPTSSASNRSIDGRTWSTADHLCIDYAPGEYAIARPVVFRSGSRFHLWFTFRGGEHTYRVGTAVSADGVHWQRDPSPLEIDVSPTGWDSNMICYAYPLDHEGRRYALYNGNDCGRTGIGLAVWDEAAAAR